MFHIYLDIQPKVIVFKFGGQDSTCAVITAFWRLSQKGFEFKACLSYTVNSNLK
jgi:hypothetical protein